MNSDSRLSTALHALLHLAGRSTPATSDELGRCMGANAVVVRRTLAGLRSAGLVRAGKGRGGGWSLGRDPGSITVREVHAALGAPSVFAVGLRSRGAGCLVEEAVNGALGGALADAEALLLERLGTVTLSHLAAEVAHRAQARGHHHRSE